MRAVIMEILREKVKANKSAIMRDLDLTNDCLTYMANSGLLDIAECAKLQQITDKTKRSQAFLDHVVRKEEDTTYTRLIDCLQEFGQRRAATKLIDVREEMSILSQMQTHLDGQLTEMNDFLTTEERRAGIYLTELPPEADDGTPAVTEQEVWDKLQTTIRLAQLQLTRCQNIITKLHQDCDVVAKQNADIIAHTKECDAKMRDVLTVGRKSAKKMKEPKRTQDLFSNLMNDIERLVKTRRNVITMETEGRRHSTRIVRQCRDWLEDRSLVLQKLHSSPSPGAFRSFEAPGDSDLVIKSRRPAPPENNNAIMSILDSLQLLETELQEYIHYEVMMTDKYRSEVRRRHLQNQSHGFNAQGISQAMEALSKLESDPSALKANKEILKSTMRQINKEYDECMSYLNKTESRGGGSPDSGGGASGVNTSPQTARKLYRPTKDWPANFKRKQITGNQVTRSLDTTLSSVGTERDTSEPNQLLNKLKMFVSQYEELKAQDQGLTQKHRSDISRKKRETEIALQRKEDQIMKLHTQLKESEAEKEKYKKLYNDTKIGYQKNRETVNT